MNVAYLARSAAPRYRRLWDAGMDVLWRCGFLVERWAPVGEHTNAYDGDLIAYFTTMAPEYALPESDLRYWKRLAKDLDSLVDQPDFCYREFFVLPLCRQPV